MLIFEVIKPSPTQKYGINVLKTDCDVHGETLTLHRSTASSPDRWKSQNSKSRKLVKGALAAILVLTVREITQKGSWGKSLDDGKGQSVLGMAWRYTGYPHLSARDIRSD
jgi:hypothetical protein